VSGWRAPRRLAQPGHRPVGPLGRDLRVDCGLGHALVGGGELEVDGVPGLVHRGGDGWALVFRDVAQEAEGLLQRALLSSVQATHLVEARRIGRARQVRAERRQDRGDVGSGHRGPPKPRA
jgi:hypothetical protein